jgi:hypothetical protein
MPCRGYMVAGVCHRSVESWAGPPPVKRRPLIARSVVAWPWGYRATATTIQLRPRPATKLTR